MEDSIKQHYKLLDNYLSSYLQSIAGRAPSSAMARVGRLPQEQFFEVSSDLHDELLRRLDSNTDLPFLPIRADLLPKRNQARQKMATLPEPRFKELAAELYFEIEKRFPQVVSIKEKILDVPKQRSNDRPERNGSSRRQDSDRGRTNGSDRERIDRAERDRAGLDREQRPLAASDGSARRRRQPSAEGDRYRPARGDRDRDRDREPNRYKSEESASRNIGNSAADAEQAAKIRADYEFKVAILEKQLREAKLDDGAVHEARSLRSQLSKLEQKYSDLQRDYDKLQADFDRTSKDNQLQENKNSKIQDDYVQIRREFELLQDDFEREQKISSDLEAKLMTYKSDLKAKTADLADLTKTVEKYKNEEISFLSDIQSLKERSRSAESAKDSLTEENNRLKEDIRTLSLAKTAAQHNIPSSSQPESGRDRDAVSPTQSIKTIQDGDIDQDNLLHNFQKISFELVNAAKNSNRTLVLGPMKNILLTCKEITQDCEKMEEHGKVGAEDRASLRDTKTKLSESLTILMTATKEHASNSGPSLLPKIEKELKTLSFSVSDLLELLKIIQLSIGGTTSRGEPIVQVGLNKRDTVRSLGPGAFDDNLPAMELPELLDYLKEQTDGIAHHIQDLLQAVPNTSSKGDDIASLVNSIAQNVDNIIYETQGTLDISTSMNDDTVADADDIVAVLGDIRNELLDLGDDIFASPSDRGIRQKIANSSYEIAKHAKELLAVLES